MRISDWSSDVCSSDLPDQCAFRHGGIHSKAPACLLVGAVDAVESDATIEARQAWPPFAHHRTIMAWASSREQHSGGGGGERKSVVEGKRASVRVTLGGCATIKKQTNTSNEMKT